MNKQKKLPQRYQDIILIVGVALLFLLACWGKVSYWLGLFGIVVCLFHFIPRLKLFAEKIEVTEDLVCRRFGFKYFFRKRELIYWKDLIEVGILTTDRGPWVEDMFFILKDANGLSVTIGNDIAVQNRFLDQLYAHCPGIDHEKIAFASCSSELAAFSVWKKKSGVF